MDHRTPVPRFVLFKLNILTAHNSHFAGGKHAFLCMASTLAKHYEVHVVSIASKRKVLVHAASTGLLPILSFTRPGVVTWREGQLLHHHVILDDEPATFSHTSETPSAGAPLPSPSIDVASIVSTYLHTLLHTSTPTPAHNLPPSPPPPTPSAAPLPPPLSFRTWLLIDADESQKPLPAPSPHPFPTSTAPNTTLFESLVASAPPRRALALVQNVHFLPLGPSGTALRDPGLLAAWWRLGGVVAVSEFVADYLVKHWPQVPAPRMKPGSPTTIMAPQKQQEEEMNKQEKQQSPRVESGQSAAPPAEVEVVEAPKATAAAAAGGGGHADVAEPAAAALSPSSPRPPIRVVPLATWGVYGTPPFPDLGQIARPLLHAWRGAVQLAAAAGAGPPAAAAVVAADVEEPSATEVSMTAPPQLQHKPHQHHLPQQQQQQPPAPSSSPPTPLREGPPRPMPVPLSCGVCLGGSGSEVGCGGVVDVAVLKLTPEKGCSVVVELARRLRGWVRFRVVAADPAVTAVLAPLTAVPPPTTPLPAPPPAVDIWEPQSDVGRVLSGCVAVVAPSLWLEAWGMVVTEALLRGLPVLVSDLGGLPEAGMHVCPAVPVAPILIPPTSAGVPDWSARSYPRQDVDAWQEALMGLLLGGRQQGEGEESGGSRLVVRAQPKGPLVGERGSLEGTAEGDVGGGVEEGGGREGCGRGVEEEEGDVWEAARGAGRRAALAHVARQGEYLSGFVEWLGGLGAGGAGGGLGALTLG